MKTLKLDDFSNLKFHSHTLFSKFKSKLLYSSKYIYSSIELNPTDDKSSSLTTLIAIFTY